jgi:ferredoxin
VLLPPRGCLWASVLLLVAASLLFPAPLGPPARLDRLLGEVELDAFYTFWLPLSRGLSPGAAWLAFGAGSLLLCLAPLWTRPARDARPPPSVGSERLCTGCVQCTLDCPYEAIAMVPRAAGGRSAGAPGEGDYALVDPERCVSCGICAGSCAPMAIGPPGRSGRDGLAELRAFVAARGLRPGDTVVAACRCAAGRAALAPELAGAPVATVSCIGNLHTSAIELLLRAGAAGVLVWSCPPRDCWFREGPRWLEERLYHGREAELRASVDRRRLRVVHAGEGERRVVLRELAALRRALAALIPPRAEELATIELACERVAERV